MHAAGTGTHGADFVDYIHARTDFAEHGITPALGGFIAKIEKVVIDRIDEKLCAGRVRIRGACHGDAAADIFQAVVGFVFDGGLGAFLRHVGRKTATLDHEILDDAMEDRAVVVAGFYVGDEVVDGKRGFGAIKFKNDIAGGGVKCHFHLLILCCIAGVRLSAFWRRASQPATRPAPALYNLYGRQRGNSLTDQPFRATAVMSHTANQPGHTPTNFLHQIVEADVAAGRHGGRVATRFPPEPNGFLHIGHAKSICLNFGLARDFNGTCNLRFDDTNPEKESQDYIDAIERDVRWLGFVWHGHVHYASNYFDQLHVFAIELIDKGLAYVDSQSAEEIRKGRGSLVEAGKASPFRARSVAENRDLFDRMRAGEFDEGQCVLRAKIDMASPNINMRDPVIYRIRKAHHHQTGDKWVVYPMYDYTHPISDALEGITHSLCTLEFEDHRPLYDWVLAHVSVGCQPRQYEFSRLNLNFTVMSKRKLKQLVDEGYVSGWDDPRMPTISGLRRRGYTPAAIRHFCGLIGVTRSDGVVDMSMLEFAIRDDLDKSAPRAMCVLRPLKVTITSWPQGEVQELRLPRHPKDASLGERVIPMTREIFIDHEDFSATPPPGWKRLEPGQEVRLRGSYVIRCDEVVQDAAGNVVELKCSHDANTLGKNPEGRKVKGVIHWVPAHESVPCEVRLYDRLFTDATPDAHEDRDFTSFINTKSNTVIAGARVEPALCSAAPEERFQFEREGYFCADIHDTKPGAPVFNLTVTLRDGFTK